MAGEYGFCKEERLCGQINTERLFEKGKGFIHYPFRVLYLPVEEEKSTPCSVLISVSKRKFKRANKRNRVKRLMREAYRLNKSVLYTFLNEKGLRLHLAIIYLDTHIQTYEEVDMRMKGLVKKLTEKLS